MVALFIAALVAVYSWACAKEEIFKECRDCLKAWHANPKLPFLVRKVCYMPTCEYCCSFWFSLAACCVFQHQIAYDDWRGYILAHGVTWALAVGYMSLYQLVRVDIRAEQAVADKTEAKP